MHCGSLSKSVPQREEDEESSTEIARGTSLIFLLCHPRARATDGAATSVANDGMKLHDRTLTPHSFDLQRSPGDVPVASQWHGNRSRLDCLLFSLLCLEMILTLFFIDQGVYETVGCF
jgi:hypothetical protein